LSQDFATTTFICNGRTYTPPARPVVTICLDGSADEYLDAALGQGLMPHTQEMVNRGYRGKVRGALPSFTNVNNASIVTGMPPSVHGISGNYFLNPETGEEVMMNGAKFLRVGTILAEAAQAGRRVAMVTAKDKLREMLSHKMQGIGFSAEKADTVTKEVHGIENALELVGKPLPYIYSPSASLFTLQAGVALLRKGMADLLYLSLTDYMQHTYAPDSPESLAFYSAIDTEIGEMLACGAVVAATADHGMNAKQKPDGTPNVLYLERLLTERFGAGIVVILPITDPYVKHHGALGSFAVVHLPKTVSQEAVYDYIDSLEGITEVYRREEAARKLELPADRIGELIVISGRDVVLGRTEAYHDLSALESGLRSHGGRYEEMVPLLISEPLSAHYRRRAEGDPRNFDLFDFALNGAE
jgi:phosphonoacetate hydrolase